jgi:putative ABC transport system permease protein
MKYPAVQNVTLSSALPGKSYNDLDNMGGVRVSGMPEQDFSLITYRVDENFMDVYGMKLIAGRNFPPTKPGKDSLLILNQKAVTLFGFSSAEEAVGKKIDFQGRNMEVIGVIENYHHKSLRTDFEPMMIRGSTFFPLYISLKLAPDSNVPPEKIITQLEQQWKQTYGDNPFNYSFLDTHVKDQYQEDARFSRVFTVFAGFSIIISCLGLFGLVSYTVTVRMKEIGVRKVLGASVGNIVLLFSRDYAKLLLVANIIGVPLAYYLLTRWLESFAYRVSLGVWVFIIPVGIVTMLAIVAVSGQIIRAALTNPVNTLRNE